MKKIDIYFSIYLNSNCDFNCKFCYYKSKNFYFNTFNNKKFFLILEKLKNYYKNRNIELNFSANIFGGESLLINKYSFLNFLKSSKEIIQNRISLSTKEIFKLDKRIIKSIDKIDVSIHDDHLYQYPIQKIINRIKYLSQFDNIIFYFSFYKEDNILNLKKILRKTFEYIKNKFFIQYAYYYKYETLEAKKFKRAVKKELKIFLEMQKRNIFDYDINQFYERKIVRDYCLGHRLHYYAELSDLISYPCASSFVNKKNKEKISFNFFKKNIDLFLRKKLFFCNKQLVCNQMNLFILNSNLIDKIN